MKTAIFLGAGASACEGAPDQSQIFNKYFTETTDTVQVSDMRNELTDFFRHFFDIDVGTRDIKYPTFEEVLCVIELALVKNQGYINYLKTGQMENVRKNLLLMIAKTLHDTLDQQSTYHGKLIDKLSGLGLLKDTLFLTTNYDLLIDNALLRKRQNVQYGLIEETKMFNRKQSTYLFKLHGSLNWLYCPICNMVKIADFEKSIMTLVDNSAKAKCAVCNEKYTPIMVAPSYFKDFSQTHLSSVWVKAEQMLHEIDKIIFCGYSFPDADMYVKYLLKRIQVNRSGSPLQIIVCNKPQKNSSREQEQERFTRFLGEKVKYTEHGFHELVEDPIKFYDDLE